MNSLMARLRLERSRYRLLTTRQVALLVLHWYWALSLSLSLSLIDVTRMHVMG